MKVKKSMKYAKGGPFPKTASSDTTKPKLASSKVAMKTVDDKFVDLERERVKGPGQIDTAARRKAIKEGRFYEDPKSGDLFPVKKKAKNGASLKPVPADKQKSLGKLPTPVRNKMGFQKDGGKTKAKSGAALKKQAAKAIAMKKAGKAPKKAMGGMKMMKGGGKCKYGC